MADLCPEFGDIIISERITQERYNFLRCRSFRIEDIDFKCFQSVFLNDVKPSCLLQILSYETFDLLLVIRIWIGKGHDF